MAFGLKFGICAAALSLSAAPASALTLQDAPSADEAPTGQLPEGVRPLAYDLDLTIDPRETRFGGTAAITLDFDEAADGVWMHGNNLDVSDVTIVPENGEPIEGSYEQVLDSGVVRIGFEETVPAGEAVLAIAYDAPFDENLSGMFRVKEGEDWYSLVKSESVQARKAFPGFDEPRFKTPFDVTLTIPEGQVAITNAPEESREDADDGLVTVGFDETRPLPTYLISMAVGPFEEYDIADLPPTDLRDRSVPLSGWARKGKADELAFIMSLTEDFITEFEEITGTPYPYDKLDIIAAPDWPSGATELAAAISYREEIILSDGDPSPRQRRRIVGIHGHELAHMWFGDFTTPPWWDDLWLKEGFAVWGEPKVAHAWDPDAGYDLDSPKTALSGMASDSLQSARPVRQEITENEDIRNAYDGITYSKGAAVLNMAETYLGKEKWRAGLKAYFEEFADGVADARDFYRVMGEAADDPAFEESLRGFVERPGLPLLQTELICEDDGAPTVEITQSRYAPLGSEIDPDMEWIVPVCVAHGGEDGRGQTCALAQEETSTIELETDSCPAWIMPNANGGSYYRFAMPAEQWDALIENFGDLTAAEALMAVDSATAAFEGGEADAASALEIIQAAGMSDDPDIAGAPLGALSGYKNTLTEEDSDARQALQAWMLELYGDRYEDLADAETEPQRLLRQRLQDFLALTAENQDLRDQLAEYAAAFIGMDGEADPEALTPDQYNAASIAAVEAIGRPFIEMFLSRRESLDDPAFESAAMSALGRTDDPEVAANLRELALEEDTEASDAFRLIAGQMGNDALRAGAWDWLRANAEAVAEAVPAQYRRQVPALAGGFCDASRIEEIDAFTEAHGDLFPGYERGADQAKERIALCEAFRDAKADEFADALTER